MHARKKRKHTKTLKRGKRVSKKELSSWEKPSGEQGRLKTGGPHHKGEEFGASATVFG